MPLDKSFKTQCSESLAHLIKCISLQQRMRYFESCLKNRVYQALPKSFMNGVNKVGFFSRGNIFCDITKKHSSKWNLLEPKGSVHKKVLWKMPPWEWLIVLEWNDLWPRKDTDGTRDSFAFLYLLKSSVIFNKTLIWFLSDIISFSRQILAI